MWFVAWLVFVIVFVGGPLLYARRRAGVDEVARLPDPRARRRPAPDEAEARDRIRSWLVLVAAVAAFVAAAWLVIALVGRPVELTGWTRL